MSSLKPPVPALIVAANAICLLGFAVAGGTQTPARSQTEGAYFVAYRTPAHISRSSPDVFHGVANQTLELLKSSEVNIVSDPERGTIQTGELFSLDSLLNLTKNAGASYLLYLTVDRPAASWLKVTLQCYELSGKLLWEEHTTVTSGLTGKNAPTKVLEHLKKKLLPRIGQPGLPKVQKPAPVPAAEIRARGQAVPLG